MSLKNILEKFIHKFNSNKTLRLLLKKWCPLIALNILDTGETIFLNIEDFKMNLRVTNNKKEHVISMEANKQIFESIFTGNSNPSEVFMEGDLLIFGNQADIIKLDAINELLWDN